MAEHSSVNAWPLPADGSDRQSSGFAAAALGALSEGVVMQLATGEIVACNPAAERILGLTFSQMADRASLDLGYRTIQEDGSPFPAEAHPASVTLRTGKALRGAVMGIQTSDGPLRWIEVSSAPILGSDGRPAAVVTTFVETSESGRAREELYRQMVETTHEGIWRLDSDQRTTFVNRRMAEMLGYTPEEMIGKSPFEFMRVEDREDAHWRLDRGKKGISESQQRRFQRKDGSEVWTILTGSPLYLGDGTYAGALAMITDISEGKRTEEDLRRRNVFVETLLENAPIGFAVSRIDDGQRVYVGSKFETIYGLEPGSIVDLEDFFARVYLDPVFREELRARVLGDIESGDRSRMRWENIPIVRHTGETRFITATNIPLHDQNLMISTVQDVTEHRQAQEALLALQADLEKRVAQRTSDLAETVRELDAFSYSVSHDLRAPLRAIEGFSAMVAKDAGESLGAENQRRLEVVRTNARKMAVLIDDLLTFSRTGRHEIRRGRLLMKCIVRAAFEEVVGDPEARKRIEFRLGPLPESEGDTSLMRQVWINLLSNAVKFSSTREKPVIEVGCDVGADVSTYWVRDNGVGFDPKYSEKLFGVFQRLHSVEEFEGTGIGLALVKRVVERHGGRVWAVGEPDRGATFSFSLPKG